LKGNAQDLRMEGSDVPIIDSQDIRRYGETDREARRFATGPRKAALHGFRDREVTLKLKATEGLPDEDPNAARFEALVADLDSRIGLVTEDALSLIGERLAVSASAEFAVGRIRAAVEDILQAEVSAFGHDSMPDHLSDGDANLVAELAAIGCLEALRHVYLVLQKSLWDAWLRVVEDEKELDPRQRHSLLVRGPDFFFQYVDLLADHVAAAALQEQRRTTKDGSRRMLLAVKGVLENDPTAPPLEAFDLEQFHLGLIAWGRDPAAAVRQLAALLQRPMLLVNAPPSRGEQCCWAWISGGKPIAPRQRDALLSFAPRDARVALGLELEGVAGFRSTYRQARRARELGIEAASGVTRYDDIAVEALASENRADAAAFVARELHGIDDDSPTSRRLRDTLRAYFCAHYNAASAAAALGVHQQTVANRLRTVEERLGHPSIGLRRVELEVALRLRECLAEA
jgi:PucR C-terminal helix-turn-helix domain/GGDEF-like domain